MLKYYQDLLKSLTDYSFLNEYLEDPLLKRLKSIGYFCGMDYASKHIYNFSEYISRYDHSLNVALITYYLTNNKIESLAGLYHDVSTPCFSHVIDYMNHDYLKQESTELLTREMLLQDDFLINTLPNNVETIINYKEYSVVDNDRPKLCADRLDAVILNSYGWIKDIDKDDIDNIISNIYLEKNEDNEKEIAFKDINVARRVKELNDSINIAMHSSSDIYMMQLLADIVSESIDKNILNYEDLYKLIEVDALNAISSANDRSINNKLNLFFSIKEKDIPKTNVKVKDRCLSPLVRKRRL